MSNTPNGFILDISVHAISIVLFGLAILFFTPTIHAQTSTLRYMVIPSTFPGTSSLPGGASESPLPQKFVLPGYGDVLVRLSSLRAYDKGGLTKATYALGLNSNVQNNQAGFFKWSDAFNDIGVSNNTSGPIEYTATFTFLNGLPDRKKLVLVVATLGKDNTGTTAVVSIPGVAQQGGSPSRVVYLAGELPLTLNGQPTLPTVLDATGTKISAGACKDPQGNPATNCNVRNTGWALFQLAADSLQRLPGPTIFGGGPIALDVAFTQESGDGIQFTLGYADNPPDPCCPPWNVDSLTSQLLFSQAGNLSSPFTFKFLNSQPALKTGFDQMQKYIDYLHSLNPSIKNIALRWHAEDCGASGPGTSPNCVNGPGTGPDIITEWSCTNCSSSSGTGIGGGGRLTIPPMASPPVQVLGPLLVNRWYRISTFIYVNDGLQFWPNACDTAMFDFTHYLGAALSTAASTNADQIAIEVRKPGENTGRIVLLPYDPTGQ
jgi:hypothetical protein